MAYVLNQLREEGLIPSADPVRGLPPLPPMVPYEHPRRDIGYITRYAPGLRENGGVVRIDVP